MSEKPSSKLKPDFNLDVLNSSHLLNITLGIILAYLLVWVLVIGKEIILPLMIALFLSFILDPIVSLLRKVKIPLGISVLLTLMFAFVILYLFGLLVYANVQLFVGQFPLYQVRLLKSLSALSQKFEIWFGEPLNLHMWRQIDWLDALQRYSIAQGVLSSVGTFLTFFIKMLIVIVFVAYLLTGKRNLNIKIANAFQQNRAKHIVNMIERITGQIQKYLSTKTIVSLITGVISMAIFYSFGLDFAIFWAFLIFIFNFIPTIGAIIASLLPVLFIILQKGSVTQAFWLTIVLGILHFSTGNIFEPKLMGRSLNLSPLVVIISLVFWGYIWGIAGMILAVPILATITIIFENFESTRFIAVFFRGKA